MVVYPSSTFDIYKNLIYQIYTKLESSIVHDYFEHYKTEFPIIIGGIGGSGTRLVVKLLREIGVQMGRLINTAEDAQSFVCLYDKYIPIYLNNQEIDLNLFEQDLLKAIQLHRQDMRPGIWGWKNPRSIYLLPLFDELIMNMRFIHVVRNGLDMVCSSNQLQLKNYGESILGQETNSLKREIRSLLLWQAVNNAATDYGIRMKHRYFLLRYEDICSDPKRALWPIVDALNLAFPEKWQQTVNPPSSRWHSLDKELINTLINVGGGALQRFGYIC
jgi:hypothetical protein